jgi:anti-sigma B factor antagonist
MDNKENKDYKSSQKGNQKVLSLTGELDLYSAPRVKKFLYQNIDSSVANMIIDLRNVRYIDSSGIGILIAAKKKMKEVNGTIALANLNNDVRKIFRLATLEKFFNIMDQPI